NPAPLVPEALRHLSRQRLEIEARHSLLALLELFLGLVAVTGAGEHAMVFRAELVAHLPATLVLLHDVPSDGAPNKDDRRDHNNEDEQCGHSPTSSHSHHQAPTSTVARAALHHGYIYPRGRYNRLASRGTAAPVWRDRMRRRGPKFEARAGRRSPGALAP